MVRRIERDCPGCASLAVPIPRGWIRAGHVSPFAFGAERASGDLNAPVRSDFRAALPQLLEGEDPAFTHAIQAMVEENLQRERGNPVQPAGERRIMFPHMRAA